MKRNIDEKFQGKDELLKQLADTKLKIALLTQQEVEMDEIGDNADAPETEVAIIEQDAFFRSTQDHALSRIKTNIQKQNSIQFTFRYLPRLAQIAASALLLFYIGLTTAAATVPSVRIVLMQMLYKIEEEYTEVSFQPDEEASFDVPSEWGGDYFMSYIPSDYQFECCSEMSDIEQEIIYVTVDGKILRFCESLLDTEINVDTEEYSVSTIQINGMRGILAKTDEVTKIVWASVDRCFILNINSSPEEAVVIAEKVVRIK